MPLAPRVEVPRVPSAKTPRSVTTSREPIEDILGQLRRVAGRRQRDVTISINSVKWIQTPQSSWVRAYRYLRSALTMQIRFKSGTVCQYSDIGPDTYRRFNVAISKGKAVWRLFYHLPYRIV